MDLKEIRRLNGLYQEKVVGGRKKLAELLGYDDTNQLNGALSGHNSFGDKLTSRFEKKLELAELWMSTPHPALWMELEEKHRKGMDFNGFVEDAFAGFDKHQLEAAIRVAVRKLAGDNK